VTEAVGKVSVLSTGTVRLRPPQVDGGGGPMLWWLFTTRRWAPPVPINVYVIEHRDGLVLFDTGQDRASTTDRRYYPAGVTGLVYRRLSEFDIGPEQTLPALLAAAGYGIDDVRTTVLSHLHQDHVGGVPELTKSEVVVAEQEWRCLEAPKPERLGLLPRHITVPGVDWRPVGFDPTAEGDLAPFTAAHDLFGDGSLILLPTPGHTPGSVSLLVRRPGRPPLLLVGDLTFSVDHLDREQLPGIGERAPLLETTRKVNDLRRRHPDLVVLPAHDPTAADRLATAG
jgi:glyoxylase-like metal-dependent hydrolase (beta-lactamase superfamily II)